MGVSGDHRGFFLEKRLTGTAGESIDDVSNDKTANNADDSSEGDSSTRLAKRDTPNEDNSFHTLTEDGDQGQENQGPFSCLSTTIDGFLTNALAQLGHCGKIF